jgi:hypothetical protein
MPVIVFKPKGYDGGNVILTVTPPENVRIWKYPWKVTPLPEYDVATGIATFGQWGANEKLKTLFVELIKVSASVADVKLVLSYKAFAPDTVVATGVWAEKVNEQFETKSWAELAGSVWTDEMEEKLKKVIRDEFGGTGKRPIYTPEAGFSVFANVMILEFQVSPANVTTQLSRVKFDITRQIEWRSWKTTLTGPVAETYYLIPRPTLWEEPNDDPNDADESDAPNGSGLMFVFDTPALGYRDPAEAIIKGWQYQNMWEFMRVGFKEEPGWFII